MFIRSLIPLVVLTAGCVESEALDGPVTLLTADALYLITATPSPDPPIAGENVLHLQVRDAEDEAPLQGGTLSVVPYMPSMNHGIMGEVMLTALGEGAWSAAWSYSMPGPWEVTVTVESDLGADEAVFAFEVQ